MDCFYSGMKKSLTALAFGTLGLGIAEFVMMGILPDVAKDLHISIPQAGHFISAYALGVCVGAPGMVLVARTRPLKHILLGLMVIYICGNLCAAASVNYWMMLMMFKMFIITSAIYSYIVHFKLRNALFSLLVIFYVL